MNTAIDILHFLAIVFGGQAIMATFVSMVSKEPVRCGFDVIKGASE